MPSASELAIMKKGGFIILFDEERRRELIKNTDHEEYYSFTDALSLPDYEFGQTGLALLCFSASTIDFLAILTKGKKVATEKYRVEFSEILNLREISIENINSRIRNNIRPYFIKSSQGIGGRIPGNTWIAVIDAIKSMRSNLVSEIDRLISLKKYTGIRLTGKATEVLLQEREALGIALDIFSGNNQLRNRVLKAWAPKDELVRDINEEDDTALYLARDVDKVSILSGISQRYIQEESAIQHDLYNWSGLNADHIMGVSYFEQGGRGLEVIYANRNALEKTLGVDLIYFNMYYNSFILVQYKLMRKEIDTYLYRPDPQCLKELMRMNNFTRKYRPRSEMKSHEEYRLNNDGFMFKLVPNVGLIPASGELIRGMYITREYMNFLIGRREKSKTPSVTFSNAPRYMTNTEFAQNVNRGWIGTSGIQSIILKTIVRQYSTNNRALMIATENVNTGRGNRFDLK